MSARRVAVWRYASHLRTNIKPPTVAAGLEKIRNPRRQGVLRGID